MDFVEGRPFAETKFKPKENPTKQEAQNSQDTIKLINLQANKVSIRNLQVRKFKNITLLFT